MTVLMQRDFTLMQRAARLSTMMPFLSDLHLDESIRQFGAPLKVIPTHQLASDLLPTPRCHSLQQHCPVLSDCSCGGELLWCRSLRSCSRD